MTLFWYVTTAMVNDKNLVNKILKGIKYVKKQNNTHKDADDCTVSFIVQI